MKPYSPIPRFVPGNDHGSLIRRVLRADIEPEVQRLDLITTTTFRLSLVDSGRVPAEQLAEGDTCVHILYQANESDAQISILGERQLISPGDFAWVPSGDTWTLSPNQLAIILVLRSASLVLPIEPSHGEYQFDGYNRETVSPSPPGVSMSRWKVTQPLSLPDQKRDRILVSLFGDLAVQYPGGVSMLNLGNTSVIRAGLGQITLVPDGLSHILSIEIH